MAWTLTPFIEEQSGPYIKWRLRCVSDASALAITDVFSETHMPRNMRYKLQGLTYMRMKIDRSNPRRYFV